MDVIQIIKKLTLETFRFVKRFKVTKDLICEGKDMLQLVKNCLEYILGYFIKTLLGYITKNYSNL